jgi:cytochrome c oxidase accessory protein FixG
MAGHELPQTRLASTDEKGRRVLLYPADVYGKLRSRKDWFQFFLMLIFLSLPWIKISGAPAILLDIPHRRFSILGVPFWAHDGPMLFFVFGGAAISLALLTALWGRIWCGWACPETVFIESLYRRVERWIEGDAFVRRRRDQENANGTVTWEWVLKRSAKWIAFFLISAIISHSLLAYFVGAESLARMTSKSPKENMTVFAWMSAITFILTFAFGWFREQFCIIMCPYGRFQSVFMDQKSMMVAYDSKRGEPRRGTGLPQGDCVNCYRCVQVCPTGVDIRRGPQQLECVACTSCIDACNEVMTRIKKPLGLIRYESEEGLVSKASSGFRKSSILRPRILILGTIWILFVTGFALTLSYRKPVTFILLRAKDSPYQTITDEKTGTPQVINHFNVDMGNVSFNDTSVLVKSENPDIQILTAANPVLLPSGQHRKLDFFIRFPKSMLTLGKQKVAVQFVTDSFIHQEEIPLVGPY